MMENSKRFPCFNTPTFGSAPNNVVMAANKQTTLFIICAVVTSTLVAKVSSPGEDHGDVAGVGGGDDFRVTHGAARLDGGSGAGFGGGDEAVSEGEKGVAANDASLQRKFRFARFPNGDAAGIDAAHLARADAKSATRA